MENKARENHKVILRKTGQASICENSVFHKSNETNSGRSESSGPWRVFPQVHTALDVSSTLCRYARACYSPCIQLISSDF